MGHIKPSSFERISQDLRFGALAWSHIRLAGSSLKDRKMQVELDGWLLGRPQCPSSMCDRVEITSIYSRQSFEYLGVGIGD